MEPQIQAYISDPAVITVLSWAGRLIFYTSYVKEVTVDPLHACCIKRNTVEKLLNNAFVIPSALTTCIV